MNLPAIAKVRIPILVAIAIAEVVGFAYFSANRLQHPNGQTWFSLFVFTSLVGVPLTVPLLWLDWMRRRGVVYYLVFLVVAFSLFAFTSWTRDERIYAFLFGGMSLVGVTKILIRLLRPVTWAQQEENLAAIRAEQNELGPITKYTVALTVWVALTAWSWSQAKHPIPLWAAIPIALPSVWFAWRLAYHVLNRKEISGDTNVQS
jgi:hypothetical protein